MFEIIIKLDSFKDIVYHDEPHKYYVKGEQFTSVTTFLHHLSEPFNEEYWSQYKAIERIMGTKFQAYKKLVGYQNVVEYYEGSVTELQEMAEVIKKEWIYKNHHATFEGSTLHNYIENYFTHKVFPYPEINQEKDIPWEEIRDTYMVMEGHFHTFYNNVKDTLIPVKIEYIVYDLDYQIAGMVDMLFYSTKLKKLVIFDWKTNTELKLNNSFNRKLLHPTVGHLDDCELSLYSLQLHTYKHIIEKNTGLELADDCYLVWFNENNASYELIKCLDVRNEVQSLLSERIVPQV